MQISKKLAFIKATRWKCNFSSRLRRVLDVYRWPKAPRKPRYLRIGIRYAIRLQRARNCA
jgi:hypothetical protein